MKKRILYCIYYISIFLCVADSMWAFYQGLHSNRTTIINQAFPISSSDRIYVKDMDTILIHNQLNGVIQCFDSSGNFEWGVQLSSTKNTSSTLVSFDENNIYLWEGKTNSVYVYQNKKISIFQKNVKSDEFNKEHPLPEEYNARIKRNGDIEYGNKLLSETISLKTNFIYYNFYDAFIGVFVNGIIFVFTKRKLDK